MNYNTAVPENCQVVVSAEQVEHRVRDIARQISGDYQGKTVHAVAVLEDGFIFMADLVRYLEIPVVCQFVKPDAREVYRGDVSTTEIFFSPEVEVQGAHVLLIMGIVESGVTQEFLMRNMLARGAASVKSVTLLDRQAARRVLLQPDYFGFLVDDSFVFGYGLGNPNLGRNLPFVATSKGTTAKVTPASK